MKAKDIDDRFKRFGTVSFTAQTKVNDFIDRLAAGSVSGTRCGACGAVFFPPRADCCHCFDDHMEWFDVSGSGTLMGFSRLSFAPTGFEADVPYCIALLDYGTFKLFGRLADELSETEVTVGTAMKTVAKQLPDGQLTYVFVKA